MYNHLSRRRFLQLSSLALAGTTLATDRLAAAERLFAPTHVGLQLWSVRDDMNKDAAGTIRALAKMGYREVECFGYDAAKNTIFGLAPMDFTKLLKDNGLTMPSGHNVFKLEDYNKKTKSLSDRAKKVIDTAAAMGQKYVVNAWIDEAERKDIAQLVKVFDAAARYTRRAGMRFGYHNHDFEFKTRIENRLIYEWLLEEVSSKYMTMEMDMYWVVAGGHKPLDWFRKYPGRFELCHAKDMSAADKHPSIEFGDGTIDFKSIFAERAKAGLQYFIIELENYVTTPMQGVEKSLRGLEMLQV